VVLGVLSFGTTGCGFLLTHGPPDDHRERTSFSCTESNGGPIVDVVWAVLNLAGATIIASDPDQFENSDAAIVGSLTWTAVGTASAVVGFNKTKRCRAAKRELASRHEAALDQRVGPEPAPADLVVRAVVISPAADTLTVGGRLQLRATAYNSSGGVIPNKAFSWSSSNDAIASVSPAGLVTAHASGRVVVAANTDNFVGTASIFVRPLGTEDAPEPPDTNTQSNAARLLGDYRSR
jgi:uncharacterized protein YjdB